MSLCFGAECWVLEKDKRKLQTSKINKLCMIREKTQKDGIGNETMAWRI